MIRKLAAAEEHPLQGHTTHQGLRIAIENRKGSVRKGVDKDGKPWRTEMKYPYGYIKGSKGADGEEIDAYVGPKKDAPNAYVVHQKDHEGKYDEDKVMLGFASKTQAREAYLAHYNTKKFLGPMMEVPMERLKNLIAEDRPLRKIAMCSLVEELAKLGAISDEEAEKALERYQSLEKDTQSPAQVARYAGLGAVAGPVVAAVGNAIRGGRAPGMSMLGHLAGANKPGAMGALRALAGSAATGAISSVAIPFVRHHLDREAEMGTLKKYRHEQTIDPQGAPAGKLPAPFEPVEKMAAGAPTRGGFLMASQLAPATTPSLKAPLQLKTASTAVSPVGRLTAAKRVGLPKVTAPSGPSIAQVAKPVGFGRPAAGATKGV